MHIRFPLSPPICEPPLRQSLRLVLRPHHLHFLTFNLHKRGPLNPPTGTASAASIHIFAHRDVVVDPEVLSLLHIYRFAFNRVPAHCSPG
ncbi:unnamed protein product [Tuber aestivum]|uniref:Uncharacterized protein n=1 Tax=Tuber aestivum TaxID=59557 RepID=A0A292PQA7_9PEZI|nr:unnamed protein product [Tuber aestivum]